MDAVQAAHVRALVEQELRIDLGLAGDVTSQAIVPSKAKAYARLISRVPGVVCGLPVIQEVFSYLDAGVNITLACKEGDVVPAGTLLADIKGNARSLLAAERTALNFCARLSGIATLTHQYVQKVKSYTAKIACTRKTTPGLRMLEKYAVQVGGGINHRFGLYDGMLIKDNHRALTGGTRQAIELAKKRLGHMVKLEVEVDTLAQLQEALNMGVDLILLDNMDQHTLSQAVAQAKGRAILEASGGVNLENVAKIAATGVDVISVGGITHSAHSLDLSLEVSLLR